MYHGYHDNLSVPRFRIKTMNGSLFLFDTLEDDSEEETF